MPPRKTARLAIVAVAIAVVAIFAIRTFASAHARNPGPPSTTMAPDRSIATVDRVVDGDTIIVKLNKKTERVRLIGIDTPETVAQDRPVGCYGHEASNFTKSLLPKNTQLRLVLDVESRDKYHRLLAYAYRASDNLFVNVEIARQGYAQQLTIPPNTAHVEEFSEAVANARAENRGLWAACNTKTKR